MATLEKEFANAKDLHSPLVEISTCSEAKANKAQTDLRNSRAWLAEVELGTKLAREDLSKNREHSAGLAEAAEKAVRQMTKMSNRASVLETEAKSLKSRIGGVSKTRDDAASSTNEKDQKQNCSNFALVY